MLMTHDDCLNSGYPVTFQAVGRKEKGKSALFLLKDTFQKSHMKLSLVHLWPESDHTEAQGRLGNIVLSMHSAKTQDSLTNGENRY